MQQESQGKRPSAQKRVAGNYSLVYFSNMLQCYEQTASLSIMSRYKTFYRNQYTKFLGLFLNVKENNSWTIQCHSNEIFQENALIGVFPY